MNLVITSSADATADYLCERLVRESVRAFRLDTDSDVASDLSVDYDARGPSLTIGSQRMLAADITSVWYRRPKPLKPLLGEMAAAEQWQATCEWTEAVEGFLAHVPLSRWLNHPSRNACASRKMEQLSRARANGLAVPRTLVTRSPAAAMAFWSECDRKIVVKPISCGYIEHPCTENDTQIYTNRVHESDLASLGAIRHCPTLLQELVDKTMDVRVTIVDAEVTAISLVALDSDGKQRLDIRRNNMQDVIYSQVDLPGAVRNSLTNMMTQYDLRFAAIDMAVTTDGQWVFFEVNPNGQWAWLDLAGACDIAGSFVRTFANAQT